MLILRLGKAAFRFVPMLLVRLVRFVRLHLRRIPQYQIVVPVRDLAFVRCLWMECFDNE